MNQALKFGTLWGIVALSFVAAGPRALAQQLSPMNASGADSPAASRLELSVATSLTASPGQVVASRAIQLPPIDDRVARVVVTAIAVDPTGQVVAVAGDDHVIRILNVHSLRVMQTLGDGVKSRLPVAAATADERASIAVGHTDLIRTLAFDASGNRLASAGNDGRLLIWDRRRDFALAQEIGSAPALADVQFSPDGGQLAAVGFDREVFLIGRSSKNRLELRCDCNDLRCCRFRDDGELLAVGGRDGHLHLFDRHTGQERAIAGIADNALHRGRIRSMVFLPQSNLLVSVAEDGQLVVTDTERLNVVSRTPVTTGRLFCVAILDSQTVVTAGSDDTIYQIQLGSASMPAVVQQTLTGHVGSIAALDAVGGMLFSGGYDATLRRWELNLHETPESKIARGGEPGFEEPQTSPR